ncbi:MAG TPA: hypothetical protein VEV63_12540 [Streptosporangiaceae bacterium]|nr:hypothetical protein [Streptosporangiaceae bacterium]
MKRVLRTSSGERRWWPVLGPIAAIALAASLVLPASRHQWELSIFRQPARYTALSFKDASELPTTAISGSRIPVSFTIGNQEGRTLTYKYVVSESDPANFPQTMATAARTLGPGRTWTVSLDVKATCSLVPPCRIVVSVAGHPERIDLLVTLTPAVHKHHARKSSHRASRHHARRT